MNRTSRRQLVCTVALALTFGAAASAIVGLAAPAHAETYYNFQSPSGNIACEMIAADDGTGTAVCKLKDHTWPTPTAAGGDCEYAGADLKLLQNHAPCAGVWPSQIFLLEDYGGLQTLSYGQTHTVGTITCGSAPSGVTCTDTSTGHFFRASRDSYQLS